MRIRRRMLFDSSKWEWIESEVFTNTALLLNTTKRFIKSFTFYGNSVQDGTPTPEAPVPILSAVNPKAEVLGLNLWDEIAESGSISDAGEKIVSPGRSRAKNYMPCCGNENYFIASEIRVDIAWYDSDGVFIKKDKSTQGTTKKAPANAKTFLLSFYNTPISSLPNYDICINVSDPAVNGTYEPYKSPYTIAATYTLRGIGEAKDTLTVRSDGTGELTRYTNEADMGTLVWNYSNGLFVTSPAGIATVIVPPYSNRQSGAMCSLYAVDSQQSTSSSSRTNKTWLRSDDKIYIKDTDYTDSAAFRAAVNGAKLCYVLATPVVTQLTAAEVAAILNGARTFSPTTTIQASNDNGIDQEFSLTYAKSIDSTVNDTQTESE